MKSTLIRLLLILSFILVLSGCFGQPSMTEITQVKSKMLNYLENKYHKEFVVDDIEYTWNTSDYQLNLHLQSNEKIKFFAYLNSETGMMGDSFLLVYWNDEAQHQFYEVFHKYFPEKPEIIDGPDIAINFAPPTFRDQVIQEGYPSLEDIIKKFPEKIKLGITIRLEMKDPTITPEDYRKRVYGIIEQYRSQWIQPDGIIFYFYNSYKDDIAKYTLHMINPLDINNAKKEADLEQYWHVNF